MRFGLSFAYSWTWAKYRSQWSPLIVRTPSYELEEAQQNRPKPKRTDGLQGTGRAGCESSKVLHRTHCWLSFNPHSLRAARSSDKSSVGEYERTPLKRHHSSQLSGSRESQQELRALAHWSGYNYPSAFNQKLWPARERQPSHWPVPGLFLSRIEANPGHDPRTKT